MDVIGIAHLNKFVPHLVEHIRTEYEPGILMLELEPNTKPSGPFALLEERLKDDWQIIPGDKYFNYDSKTKKLRDRITEIDKKVGGDNPTGFSSNIEGFKDIGFLLSAPLKLYPYHLIDTYNPKLIAKRNQGFYETIYQNNPDVAIVGAAHAYAIKKMIPDVNLKIFLVNTPSSYVFMPALALCSLIYKTCPDEIIWYPKKIGSVNCL